MNPQVFRDAAAVIRSRGKATGVYVEWDGECRGAVCTIGALGVALHNDPYTGWYAELYIRVIADTIRDTGYTTPDRNDSDFLYTAFWSDQAEVTAEDAAAMLEKAAERAESLVHAGAES